MFSSWDACDKTKSPDIGGQLLQNDMHMHSMCTDVVGDGRAATSTVVDLALQHLREMIRERLWRRCTLAGLAGWRRCTLAGLRGCTLSLAVRRRCTLARLAGLLLLLLLHLHLCSVQLHFKVCDCVLEMV